MPDNAMALKPIRFREVQFSMSKCRGKKKCVLDDCVYLLSREWARRSFSWQPKFCYSSRDRIGFNSWI